jgi:NhaP-type Na+/H+ or K+/H+ antiporter
MILDTVYSKIALAMGSSLVAAQLPESPAVALGSHIYAYIAAILGIVAGMFARVAWLRETKKTKQEITKDTISSALAIFAYFIVTMMIVETVGITSPYAIACLGMGLVLCGIEFTVSIARKYLKSNSQSDNPPSGS